MSRETGEPLGIAVLISGGGTTLRNILERIDEGSLNARVKLVVSSRSDAAGLAYAEEAGTKTEVVSQADCESPREFQERIFEPCRRAEVDLVVMAGFLKHLTIPVDFANRVVNIHPSLIPKYCGKGFYGLRVHQAVLDAGEATSGCTIHFVDDEFDHGPIILQQSVNVEPGDTAQALAARVFQVECEAYPRVIGWIADGRVTVENGKVTVTE